MSRQGNDVFAPLRERRENERDDVEAIVKVLAEAPGFHLDVEVTVRGGNDPYVHRRPLSCTDRTHLAVLQYPQELGLQSKGHIADLIQEQRPSVRCGDKPLVVVDRPGERGFAVSEQFRLEQIFRDGGAIDRNERSLRASARTVYGAREELLSGAARALDEHARFRLGDQARLMEHVLHFRALRHQAPPPVRVVPALSDSGKPQRLLHLIEQVLSVERLGLKAENPAACGGDRVRDRAVRSQDDDGKGGGLLADLVEQGQAVDSAHLEVRDDELWARRREHGQRLLAALGSLDAVAGGGKAQGNEFQDVRVVVDEKNRAHLGRACSRSMILRSTAFSASSCSFSWAVRRCSRKRSLIWA